MRLVFTAQMRHKLPPTQIRTIKNNDSCTTSRRSGPWRYSASSFHVYWYVYSSSVFSYKLIIDWADTKRVPASLCLLPSPTTSSSRYVISAHRRLLYHTTSLNSPSSRGASLDTASVPSGSYKYSVFFHQLSYLDLGGCLDVGADGPFLVKIHYNGTFISRLGQVLGTARGIISPFVLSELLKFITVVQHRSTDVCCTYSPVHFIALRRPINHPLIRS